MATTQTASPIKMTGTVAFEASKAAEVAALRTFSAACATGTYLRSLLSDKLLDWFEGNAMSDMSTDIEHALSYQILERQKMERATAEAKDAAKMAAYAAEKEIETVKRAMEKDAEMMRVAVSEVTRMAAVVDQRDDTTESLKAEIARLTRKVDAVKRLGADALWNQDVITPNTLREVIAEA